MKMHLSPDDYKTAENNGISNRLAYQRFYTLGWTAEQTITEPPRVKEDRKKWLEIAEKKGIPSTTFYHRVSKRMNWSNEKAATTPVRRYSR